MQKNQYLIAMALCAGGLLTSGTGCELIASVDRSLIQDGQGGGSGGSGGGGGQGAAGGGKAANGEACEAGDDCESGNCADAVCCDTACDAPCDACTSALKASGDDGTCGPAKAGSACGEATCTDGTATSAGTCDGTDVMTCAAGTETDCMTFACDPATNACFEMCTEDANCAPCHVCNAAGACEPATAGEQGSGCSEPTQACDAMGECKAANGQSCTAAADCGAGNCVDGVCCDGACGGPCQACNIEGSEGTCSPVARGEVEPTCTEPSNVCDGAGVCKKGGGDMCANPAECASGACQFGVCGNP